MNSDFNKISHTDHYKNALESGDINKAKGICDTGEIAKKQTQGYLRLLEAFLDLKPNKKKAVDIGCGTGDITANFKQAGMDISGIEYTKEGVEVAKRFHPDMEFAQGDITIFREEKSFDFIFTKQVYPFHSVNAFTEQTKIIDNLIDSLKSDGVLMVLVSDAQYPHCLMHDLISWHYKQDSRLQYVSTKMYDKIFEHFSQFVFGQLSYKIIEITLKPLLWYKKKHKNWNPVYILIFQKGTD